MIRLALSALLLATMMPLPAPAAKPVRIAFAGTGNAGRPVTAEALALAKATKR